MSLRFRCHHCRQKIRVDDRMAGREAVCPSCHAQLIVPDRGTMADTTTPTTIDRPKEPPPHRVGPSDSRVGGDPDLSMSPLWSSLPVPQPVRPARPTASRVAFPYPGKQRLRVAVIGAGAVGCYYGAKLAKIGHDVHFLMRRDLEATRTRGLTIHSPDGDFHIAVNGHATAEDIGPVDLVICALKTTAMVEAQALVRPCVGPETFVLALMNGLGVEDALGRWFGRDRVFGGLAFVCLNRGEPGVVNHLDYGRLTFGHLVDDVEQTRALAAMFAETGLETHVAQSLTQARWEKLVWNVPFNSLSVSAGGVSTQRILDDDGLNDLARILMAETIDAANACGASINAAKVIDKMFAQTATMGHYKTSMMIDYEQGRPLEADSILGEPVRQAQAAGLGVPHMAMQYQLVRFLDLVNRGVLTRYE